MKKILLSGLILVVSTALVAQDTQIKVGDKKSTPTITAVPLKGPLRRNLSIRERREYGLTVINIKESFEKLKQSGAIDNETSLSEASVLVAEDIKSRNNGLNAPNIDWEAVFAFIELILKLFALFA